MEDGNGAFLEAYTYDAQGNRLTQFNLYQGIGNRTYDYDDEDRLLQAGDTTFNYNVDGFLTQKVSGGQTTTYTYSTRGETKEVALASGTVVSYEHDVLGRPVTRLVDGAVTEKYLWLDRTTLLAVYNADDSLRQRFIYGDGRMPLAMEQDGQTYYLVYDQVSSLRAVTDADGNILKTVLYDSFGNVVADSNSGFAVPFGFAGGLVDADTGLVRFGYRDYDPEVGRWTAKDPILFAGGDVSLYLYAGSNPVGSLRAVTDVDGRFSGLSGGAGAKGRREGGHTSFDLTRGRSAKREPGASEFFPSWASA